MSARVLVTGSHGHIGRVLVQRLLDLNYEVRTFDSVAKSRSQVTEHLPGDLRDLNLVRRATEEIDAVVHLGAISNDSRGIAPDIMQINVIGTWNVLQASVEAGVSRLVNFSSVNALGNFMGYRKADHLPIDDAYPRHPQSTYQLSKHLGEDI